MKNKSEKRRIYADIRERRSVYTLERYKRIKAERRKFFENTREEKTSQYHSLQIDMLAERKSGVIVASKRKLLNVNIPKSFSVIHNPEKSIEILTRFAYDIRHINPRVVRFNHSEMEEVDLAAEYLLDIVAIEIAREQKYKRKKIRFKGTYPEKEELRRYLRATGIIKKLEIEHEYLPKSEETKLRMFNERNKRISPKLTYNAIEYKATTVRKFVDHINLCLKDHGRQLTHDSILRLADYTGEIIDNAEEHSGFNDWTIAGYLDNNMNEHICEICIFNFGKTIADTLKDIPDDSFISKTIRPYIDTHKDSGLFSRQWTEDNLLTLVALQGHISSKNLKPTDDRGQGTVEIINFFQKVHKECTQESAKKAYMAVLSGSTHIFFDGKYKMQDDSRKRKVIAFNNNNDLKIQPDKRYVKNLDGAFFPGTIISIQFPLQVSHMEKVPLYGEQ